MANGMSCEGEGWIHEGNSNDDTVLIASTTVQFVTCVFVKGMVHKQHRGWFHYFT